ncbi:TetR/AcrR family transcriptional regulator [Microbacterium sp. CIAB417]|uniref:TetR/AcrR family transcriptional regulator n=1 Tax=Microbacterium sp. CIAB417 TaxID=2860287 RepID=UPI001FAC3970|nr:TetR/AcrR family transcriptional regulator [Microbacterium sp. CIAB417]
MTGRRDRNMQEKRTRILEAAAALFEEHGFAAVTTQQISDRADVAAGTLFRYASSKGELLLMVYNERYRAVIDEGALYAASASDPEQAVLSFVGPVIEWAAGHPENSTAYQRELMFGAPTERFRAEGLSLVADFEDRIAELLAGSAGRDPAAAAAAGAVFAVVHLAIARLAHRPRTAEDAALLRRQIGQIITGFRAEPRAEQ